MTKNTRNPGAKKLALSRETLRQLTDKDLAGVRGASSLEMDKFPTFDCAVTAQPID